MRAGLRESYYQYTPLNADGGVIATLLHKVLIRLVRQPFGSIDGVSLEGFRVGNTYELAATLAVFIIAVGCGILEMRRAQRSKRFRLHDRRQCST